MASKYEKIVSNPIYTHGGTKAVKISNEMLLRRSVLSCLLWEKEFYEDGESIADRIFKTASLCSKKFVADLAYEARHIHGLRHVPLLLLLNLVSRSKEMDNQVSVRKTISAVIRRPDEITELLALYWKDKKKPIASSLRRGLADAFLKFNEYSLQKYNNQGRAIKLRDVMFLVRPKPRNQKEVDTFKKLADNNLPTPKTWETRLSAGEDKNKVFTEMLENTLNPEYKDRDNTLGYMALLRNLRNMTEAKVDPRLMREAILLKKGAELVFPFRYVAAARACPSMEPYLDKALISTIKNQKPLPGTTVVMVDCSGSMRGPSVSAKSDIDRITAAATLASMINGDHVRLFTFANNLMELPHRIGMAGVDAIIRSQNGGTELFKSIREINNGIPHDRLIVITDEQDTSYGREKKPDPRCALPYMINVASYRNGVGYGGNWIHLDGFSEGILRYIYEIERYLGEIK